MLRVKSTSYHVPHCGFYPLPLSSAQIPIAIISRKSTFRRINITAGPKMHIAMSDAFQISLLEMLNMFSKYFKSYSLSFAKLFEFWTQCSLVTTGSCSKQCQADLQAFACQSFSISKNQ